MLTVDIEPNTSRAKHAFEKTIDTTYTYKYYNSITVLLVIVIVFVFVIVAVNASRCQNKV